MTDLSNGPYPETWEGWAEDAKKIIVELEAEVERLRFFISEHDMDESLTAWTNCDE